MSRVPFYIWCRSFGNKKTAAAPYPQIVTEGKIHMKYIKIFLASSIDELKVERLMISDFIRSLNDKYVKHGIYFQLYICENISSAIDIERKQDQYNKLITKSDYFYVLFGTEAGKFTVEEFNVAHKSFTASGAPKIYTYFFKPDSSYTPADSVKSFMTRLDREIGHYYTVFTHIDTVKLHILIELTRELELGESIKLEDGKVVVSDECVISVKNIPLYSNNDSVKRLLRDIELLEKEFTELSELAEVSKGSSALSRLISENVSKRAQLKKSLHSIENDMLALYSDIAEKRRLGSGINWREKEAIRMIDQGLYEAAKQILRDKSWSEEIKHVGEIIDTRLEQIEEYISGKATLIKAIRSTGVDQDSCQEIIACYEEIASYAEKYHVKMDMLCEYAYFLMDHRNHAKAIEVAERLDRYYDYQGTKDRHAGDVKYLLACLSYKTNDVAEAEKYFKEALAIRKPLASRGNNTDRAKYAFACTQFGYFLFRNKKYCEAESLYSEALSVQTDLTAQDEGYKTPLAFTVNNMALLYEKVGNVSKATEYHNTSLKLRQEAALNGTDTSLGYLAMSYLNRARLNSAFNPASDPSDDFSEAIKIYHELSKKDTKYESDCLIAKYHYAVFVEGSSVEEALVLHREVLEGRKSLSRESTSAYLSDLSDSYLAVGRIMKIMNIPDSAEMLKRSYEIRRELYSKAKEKYGEAFEEICKYYKE